MGLGLTSDARRAVDDPRSERNQRREWAIGCVEPVDRCGYRRRIVGRVRSQRVARRRAVRAVRRSTRTRSTSPGGRSWRATDREGREASTPSETPAPTPAEPATPAADARAERPTVPATPAEPTPAPLRLRSPAPPLRHRSATASEPRPVTTPIPIIGSQPVARTTSIAPKPQPVPADAPVSLPQRHRRGGRGGQGHPAARHVQDARHQHGRLAQRARPPRASAPCRPS